MARPIKLTDELTAQIKRLVGGLDEFPEDAWYEITENIDLNLWTLDGQPRATLYRVRDGNTITNDQTLDITKEVCSNGNL